MTLKLLQLNIFQGKFLNRIVDFIKASDIDLLNLQEVTGGTMSQGGKYRYSEKMGVREFSPNDEFVGADCFRILREELNMNGVFVKTTGFLEDQDSYIGNATLFKKRFEIINSEELWLKNFFLIDENFTDIASLPRAALITTFRIDGKELTTVNAHLSWGPDPFDEPYKINQASRLNERIKKISNPLILSGDFNVTPQTKTASIFNDAGQNLTLVSKITNTLNPREHPVKKLFPPGLAVDYIFVSRDIKINSFRVIDEPSLSDHFGLLLEFET